MATFSLRMPDDDHEVLKAMSVLTGKPMSVLVNEAIREMISRYAQSGDIQQKMEQDLLKRRQAVDKLMKRRRSSE